MSDNKKYRIRAALDFLNLAGKDTLTGRQMRVLLVCRKGPQTVRGMAKALNLSKPAITRARDRLEQEGFLWRETDAADRRSVNVLLTTSGDRFAGHFE